MSEAIDVLVVGGGPTGLAMACELARRGLRARLVDASERGSEHSKALVVHARTLEVFACMGVLPAVQAAAQPMVKLRVFADGQELAAVGISDLPPGVPRPVILDQSTTEQLLEARLRTLGGQVERRTRLLGLRDLGDRVVATVRRDDGSEEEIAARWLVGCDGAHSAVRRGIGVAFEGSEYADTFDQADLKIRWDRRHDEGLGFLREQGAVVFLPLPRDRWRILLVGGDGHGPEPTLKTFQDLVARVAPDAELYDPEWIIRFRLHRRIAARMAVGRVFLAGDAAHIHSPAGGQGMNTGIQDAFALAWKLALVARGAARPELLATYHDERHPVIGRIVAFTDRTFRAGLAASPLASLLRRFAARALLGRRALQRRIALTASQTRLNYREAASSVDARPWARPGPRAGDRVADAALAEGTGATTLYAALSASPGYTLLLMHGERREADLSALGAEIAARWGAAVTTRELTRGAGDPGELHAAWRVREPELVLLRPDGHIAVRTTLRRAAALREYLARWLAA